MFVLTGEIDECDEIAPIKFKDEIKDVVLSFPNMIPAINMSSLKDTILLKQTFILFQQDETTKKFTVLNRDYDELFDDVETIKEKFRIPFRGNLSPIVEL